MGDGFPIVIFFHVSRFCTIFEGFGTVPTGVFFQSIKHGYDVPGFGARDGGTLPKRHTRAVQGSLRIDRNNLLCFKIINRFYHFNNIYRVTDII